MAYSIYGIPYNPTQKVLYGIVETIEQATAELRRLREAGVLKVYAIGLNHETAELQKPLAGAPSK